MIVKWVQTGGTVNIDFLKEGLSHHYLTVQYDSQVSLS